MQYHETPLSFDCDGARLIGILTTPIAPERVGVVVVVGGPQYRVGSHRQFVLLARALADAGIPSLRFDCRGMGDSEGHTRTFESIDEDLAAAIDAFQRETSVTNIVLWGLCDGASAALMYASFDARIAGVAAVNPWARWTGGQAAVRLRHYYVGRLVSQAFWRKLVSGALEWRSSVREIAEAIQNTARRATPTPAESYLQRMRQGLVRFHGSVLVILSANDLTAREFERWLADPKLRAQLLHSTNIEVYPIDDADHTFSEREHRVALEDKTIAWIRSLR